MRSVCWAGLPDKHYELMKFLCRLLLAGMAVSAGCMMPDQQAFAQPDPDFHIFLCFGQSNMVGQAPIEACDMTVSDRFLMMSPVGCDQHPKHEWSVAVPPLCRCDTKLGPVDYFGRTLLEYLPENVRVGVIVVAVDGTAIDLFHPNKYKAYVRKVYETQSLNYQANQINAYDDRNPLQALLTCAKLAQQDGVIKGVIMHQGETGAHDDDYYWRKSVKEVYQNILKELNLSADSVPFFAGEAVRGDVRNPGQCANANTSIGKLPKVITSPCYVISSEGCSWASDRLHFDAAGYRELGKRYAETYLSEYLGLDLTGVERHETDPLPQNESEIYGINGYRLETLQPGVNLINGKKYLVK